MDFLVEIVGIGALTAAFRQYPAISAPILQRALSASGAVLAKNTNRSTVPWRTGFLTQTFQAVLETGKLHWYPTASYARFVEFGTAPHIIEPKNAQALYWPGAAHPVRIVHHPGSKANPYMERIIETSQEEINSQFGTALKQITEAIAQQTA
jgi:hypothetical protein